MRVYASADVHSMYEAAADLVNMEAKSWNGRTLSTVISTAAYAITARVCSLVFNSFLIFKETILFIPRMIAIGVGLCFSEKFALSTAFFERVLKVYALVLKTMLAQISLSVSAIFVPELVYGKCAMQKAIFSLELQAMIETLPDLPHLPGSIRKAFSHFVEHLVRLNQRLGMTNLQWRKQLREACLEQFALHPQKGSEILSPSGALFQTAFYNALTKAIADEVNLRAKLGTLTPSVVLKTDPAFWMLIVKDLTPKAQIDLFAILPDLEQKLQEDPVYIKCFISLANYRFRSPNMVSFSNNLLEKMCAARDELMQKNIFTASEIRDLEGSSLHAIIRVGFMRFLESAELSNAPKPTITFTNQAGDKLHLTYQQAKQLIDLKKKLNLLTPAQSEALFQHCCDKMDIVSDEAVGICFNRINAIQDSLLGRLMNLEDVRSEDQTPWNQAYSVPDDAASN